MSARRDGVLGCVVFTLWAAITLLVALAALRDRLPRPPVEVKRATPVPGMIDTAGKP